MSATNSGSFSMAPTVIVDITGPRGIVQWPVTPHSYWSDTGRPCAATIVSPTMVFATPVSTTSGQGQQSTSLSATLVHPLHCCLTVISSSLNSYVRSWHSLLPFSMTRTVFRTGQHRDKMAKVRD
ncbi:hypothetical protein E2C01_056879 [Portunus trituberculatus]|uniref:Uncharacterized protein n=1 Tax=Portunus trituberculatus TaxID=210409 RepID=A0A5B7H0S5_PORTR|nr:hypothetical protein [Portunus trituberculatus]